MKRQISIVWTFGLLLLCFTSKVAYAQQTVNCSKSHLENGSVCNGTVNNYYYYPATQNPETPAPIPEGSIPAKPHDPYLVNEKPVSQEPLTSQTKLPTVPIFPGNSVFDVKVP